MVLSWQSGRILLIRRTGLFVWITSTFQAELIAIFKSHTSCKHYLVCTDSRSALQTILNMYSMHPLAVCCATYSGLSNVVWGIILLDVWKLGNNWKHKIISKGCCRSKNVLCHPTFYQELKSYRILPGCLRMDRKSIIKVIINKQFIINSRLKNLTENNLFVKAMDVININLGNTFPNNNVRCSISNLYPPLLILLNNLFVLSFNVSLFYRSLCKTLLSI